LLVVDENYALKGLITVKDIQKKLKYPNAAKDDQGRLRAAAAVGATGDFLERASELVAMKVDAIAIDSAHGHSQRVMDAVKAIKRKFPEVQILAGNVASYEGARDLIALGADGIKVGIGPGSICTTRVVSGAGVPQITAIAQCAKATREAGIPLISDGGVKYSGDITKAEHLRAIEAWARLARCRRAALTATPKQLTVSLSRKASKAAFPIKALLLK
jgi:IMP dehydrogenase